MTEPVRDNGPARKANDRAPKRAVVRRPGPFAVLTGAIGSFLAVFALLSWQMASGHDPAIGAGDISGKSAKQARPKRKVILTRVVHDPPKPDPAAAASSGTAYAAGSTSAGSSYVPSTSAPAPAPSAGSSAPAPSPAPAPAPAPAPPPPPPVATQSS